MESIPQLWLFGREVKRSRFAERLPLHGEHSTQAVRLPPDTEPLVILHDKNIVRSRNSTPNENPELVAN
jgi:hypothetical protein